MHENPRWRWKDMPGNYYASYYNEKDFGDGRKFIIVDTFTGREYIYPEFEKRIGPGGLEYTQRVISQDLYNQEFINWACSTSPDYALYVGVKWMIPELMEILVSTPQNIRVFDNVPENRWNQDLCQRAFDTNPRVYSRLPKQYLTPEMTEIYVLLEGAWMASVPEKFMSEELFIKAYNSRSSIGKVNLIRDTIKYSKYITKEIAEEVLELEISVIENIPSEFISSEHAKKAVLLDGKYLQYVPVKFRTKELCYLAFESNPSDSIAFIPSQFHTLQMHKKVIDIKASYISRIPEDVLSEEIIYYAISRKSSVLGLIPEERRTEMICSYAFNISSSVFSHIPKKFRTYDICLKAIIDNSKSIRNVPLEVLNQRFIDELKLAGVVIPSNHLGYVKECLIINERLEKDNLFMNSNAGNTENENPLENIEIKGEFASLSIEEEAGLFTTNVLNVLHSNGINTVGELLIRAMDSKFVLSFSNTGVANEILGAVKLLRCKYLDEDPLIAEDDSLDMDVISHKLGFSVKTMNSLRRGGFNYEGSEKKFFELMRNTNVRERELMRLRNLGERGYVEIINKTQIVLDYHDRHKVENELEVPKVENPTLDDKETLDSLNEELSRLRLEMQRITARTDEVLAKIQQKMLEQSKGGTLNWKKK